VLRFHGSKKRVVSCFFFGAFCLAFYLPLSLQKCYILFQGKTKTPKNKNMFLALYSYKEINNKKNKDLTLNLDIYEEKNNYLFNLICLIDDKKKNHNFSNISWKMKNESRYRVFFVLSLCCFSKNKKQEEVGRKKNEKSLA
jgi:hypothetical protein